MSQVILWLSATDTSHALVHSGDKCREFWNILLSITKINSLVFVNVDHGINLESILLRQKSNLNTEHTISELSALENNYVSIEIDFEPISA